jgi:hypothetical protein
MAGLWKAWKTKSRFPTLPTSPLEISLKAARFPHFHSSGDEADGKVENQEQVFPLSHRPFVSLSRKNKTNAGGLRPPPAVALRARGRGQE